MIRRAYPYVLIPLIALFQLVACAKPTPWKVVMYTTNGANITLKPLWDGAQASWSPDGKWIAYVNSGIWIATPDGKVQERLIESGSAPSWSPDSKMLAYADEGIWVLELEGRTKKQLTKAGYDPCWLADSQHIMYAAKGIWSIAVTDGEPEQLLQTGIDPACAPEDNRFLVELFNAENLQFDIFMVQPEQKPQLFVADAESPAWSADGKYILYCSTGIWLAATDGSKKQRLTVYGHQPSWSPDGKKILLTYKDQIWQLDSPYPD
jgi:Tol biopolymer transport system component